MNKENECANECLTLKWNSWIKEEAQLWEIAADNDDVSYMFN